MNKLKMRSKDNITDNIEKIQELFPNAITESEDGVKIDFDILKQELSNDIVEGSKERYQLTWPGKKEAILTANTPTTKTLRPIKEKSENFNETENIYIEGDNLDALKILQESYLGKVKCIYIDPPYNTGKDFIYKDNFSKDKEQELIDSGQIDEDGNRFVQNNNSNGRYHSDWINMMYSRLKIAKNLLSKDGTIFISIDSNEIHNLRQICNEIYGESTFLGEFIWKKKSGGGNDANSVIVEHEYILVYGKSKFSKLNKIKMSDEVKSRYKHCDSKGDYSLDNLHKTAIDGYNYSIVAPDGSLINYAYNAKTKGFVEPNWRCPQKTFETWKANGLIEFKYDEVKKWIVHTKLYLSDNPVQNATSILLEYGRSRTGKDELSKLFEGNYFDYPKSTILISHFLELGLNKDDIVLDFFSGSATTAHAAMKINSRINKNIKYIMVQLPEVTEKNSLSYKSGYKNICEIGQERIRRAAQAINVETNADIDYGFRVFKVDSSNMKEVYYRPNEFRQDNLSLFESNIKADRNDDDLLTQVILDLGLTLDLKIEERTINNHKVYFVAGNSLVACFGENVEFDVIEKLCEFKPLKLVLRDSSFESDQDKINALEKVKILTSNTEVSVL